MKLLKTFKFNIHLSADSLFLEYEYKKSSYDISYRFLLDRLDIIYWDEIQRELQCPSLRNIII